MRPPGILPGVLFVSRPSRPKTTPHLLRATALVACGVPFGLYWWAIPTQASDAALARRVSNLGCNSSALQAGDRSLRNP